MVRLSGPAADAVAKSMLGCLPAPRMAHYGAFRGPEGAVLDFGIALYFPAPRSLTGENVLELHGHGGPVSLDMLVRRAVELGARPARPGEFSERAFMNGKMDLAQAEGVADLIACTSDEAAKSAMRSLSGEFSGRIRAMRQSVLALRAEVEANLDFPEEDLDTGWVQKLVEGLRAFQASLGRVQALAGQGALLREGMTVVIAGPPNAGKSTLLNALAQRQTAIVTEIPGTTRDVLRECIHIDGMPLHVLDTAGLRDTSDPLEKEGVRRAWQAISEADRLLLVVDDTVGAGDNEREICEHLPPRLGVTVVRNKVDLSGRPCGRSRGLVRVGEEVALSAATGEGLGFLRQHLKECVSYQGADEGVFMARRRHLEALDRAQAAAAAACDLAVGGSWELVADELRLTQQALGEITGEVRSEDVLDRIFSTFCIGK
jgi:tRNA modification GTPase